MPNHIYTKLELTGNIGEINQFICLVSTKESNLDFNCAVPMSTELLNTEVEWGKNFSKEELEAKNQLKQKYAFDNWYDWSVANWGTK